MARLIVALLAATLVAGLAWTNPDTGAFAKRVADELHLEPAGDLGIQGIAGGLIAGATRGLLEEAIRQRAQRSNYALFSLFTLQLPGEDVRGLGIAGRVILIGGPQGGD